jgi:hypothetical protein
VTAIALLSLVLLCTLVQLDCSLVALQASFEDPFLEPPTPLCTNHAPVSTCNAAIESTSICSEIPSAFFLIDHLVGLGLYDRHVLPITIDITVDPTTPPPSMSSVWTKEESKYL